MIHPIPKPMSEARRRQRLALAVASIMRGYKPPTKARRGKGKRPSAWVDKRWSKKGQSDDQDTR